MIGKLDKGLNKRCFLVDEYVRLLDCLQPRFYCIFQYLERDYYARSDEVHKSCS